ncbi:putative acyl-CoA dehydrogenase [Actinacidiphila reveromycinica]|uniref:Putative acyl-CoA dehydrogenase n=1 Tax=Actinacidiphila reveromycinica TaxID=659352 RepID=A0A7U3VM00_9ACTN|nr:acyl-CoA dehydrogenase family protein [Streptomyces sp. SN-593]BBA96064.1 putative acyl-CoA dehydrogenase [Streptomyces sp. SN-593]
MTSPTRPAASTDAGSGTAGSAPAGTPDLLYSDVEDDLRGTVRALLADRCPPDAVLARAEDPRPYDAELWRLLAADLGLAGLLVPERLGGQGASARETAVVLEELGGAVAPTPFLGSAVLATSTLLGCDTADGTVADLLRHLATGEATAALAVPLAAAPGGGFPAAVRADAEGRLTGRVTSVADAVGADVLVVPALGPAGPGLYEVAAADASVEPFSSLDLTRPLADVVFDGAAARPLPAGDAAVALDAALRTGAGLLASEQVGLAQWCLDETVRYLGQRHQFGRVVGSFQSLKHRLADVWLEVVSARAAARAAADALATGSPDAPVAVAVAQAYAAAVAVHAAEEAVQLHGGIGMTWEHPAHLYLKRAKADEIALGTPGRHRAALAPLIELPPPGR